MGCCMGSTKVEISDKGMHTDPVEKEEGEEEGRTEKTDKNEGEEKSTKEVDSGFEEDEYSKYARSPAQKPRRPKTSPEKIAGKRYKALDGLQKVYKSQPACVLAVKSHPDPYMLTPRHNDSRSAWASPRALEKIPEADQQYRPPSYSPLHSPRRVPPRRPHTVNVPLVDKPSSMDTVYVPQPDMSECVRSSLSDRQTHSRGSSRLSTPASAWQLHSRGSSRLSTPTTARQSHSRVSIRNVELAMVSESMDSDVPWTADVTTDVTPKQRSRRYERHERVNLLLEELARRYKRDKPPGYKLSKRKSEMARRIRKHCVRLDASTARPASRESQTTSPPLEAS